MALEAIHHYVEVLDRYFGNVCELDIIFNFHKVRRRGGAGWLSVHARARWPPRHPTPRPHPPLQAYYLLDEMMLGGELQESNKREVLRVALLQDDMMTEEDKVRR